MAYVPVPKDLSKVKTKVAFNLTKRQIVCFAAALLFGLPLFFLLKDSTGTSLASMAMIAVMLPCFLFAMYEKHGQPLEVVVKNMLAATKDTDRLFSMLPYKTLAFSKIEGRHGTYALIDKGENRDRKIRKPRPSIRAQLKADKAKTAPKKAAAKTKNHDMEV